MAILPVLRASQIAANKVSSRLIFYNKNDLFLSIGLFENNIFENKKIYIYNAYV